MVRRRSTSTIGQQSDCSTEPPKQRRRSLLDYSPKSQKSVQSIVVPPPVPSAAPQFCSSGNILSRTTASSKLLRKWQPSYWVHLLPATLLVFRCEQDFQKWKEERNGDVSTTCSRKSRKLLLDVDFDTLGILDGPHDIKGISKNNKNSLLANSKGASPKLVSRVQKHSLGDVESCMKSQLLFTFKLESFSSVGVDVVATFASAESEELRNIRRVIHGCIQITTRQTKQRRRVSQKGEEDTHGSTLAGSEMTPRRHVAKQRPSETSRSLPRPSAEERRRASLNLKPSRPSKSSRSLERPSAEERRRASLSLKRPSLYAVERRPSNRVYGLRTAKA